MRAILFLLLLALNFPLYSQERESLKVAIEECYASAMIGYDYVVNSRAGLPIERALNTVTVNQKSDLIRNVYKNNLTSIVENAYQWQNTPHEYAVEVMFACAFDKGKQNSPS